MSKSAFRGSDTGIHCILLSLLCTETKMTCSNTAKVLKILKVLQILDNSIKAIIWDGYCVIRSFQRGLSFCYGKVECLGSLLLEFRSEKMKNYDFYWKFST